MKIRIWVLATLNIEDGTPALPFVYSTEAEANAGFDEKMREEWAAHAS